MRRVWVDVLVVCALALGVSACGNRGKLKSPTQIQVQAEKKARKDSTAAAKAYDAKKTGQAVPESDQHESSVGTTVTPSNDVAR